MERIIVNNISKKFRIGFKKRQSTLSRTISFFSGRETKKDLWALKDVSFSAHSGDVVGIIGENGSGKSTLLRVIAGIYKPDSGEVKINGKIVSLISLGVGMQERLTMMDNIYLCCSLFNLDKKTTKKRFNSIVEFSELEEFVNTKLYQFSGGMLGRLAFSIAIHCDPEILLLDEVFGVGDKNFNKKGIKKIKELVKEGVTVILASHDLGGIQKYCNKAILIKNGEIVLESLPKDVVKLYKMKEMKLAKGGSHSPQV